jgi:CheY-like chemotaxis protein
VLLNLIINVSKAMLAANGRGTLVVRSRHDMERESIVFEISDDGPGVPEDVRRDLDPFFTTKEVGQGTGLGLTVAYAIVQEHGGRIRLTSHPGAGTSFFVELPVIGTAVRRPAVPASTEFDALIGSTVLMVEDEQALAAALADALTEAGLKVERAGDGEEALRRLGEKSYDLIVCDLKMPKVDGMRFYRNCGCARTRRRVIFVTGDAQVQRPKSSRESGCRYANLPLGTCSAPRARSD